MRRSGALFRRRTLEKRCAQPCHACSGTSCAANDHCCAHDGDKGTNRHHGCAHHHRGPSDHDRRAHDDLGATNHHRRANDYDCCAGHHHHCPDDHGCPADDDHRASFHGCPNHHDGSAQAHGGCSITGQSGISHRRRTENQHGCAHHNHGSSTDALAVRHVESALGNHGADDLDDQAAGDKCGTGHDNDCARKYTNGATRNTRTTGGPVIVFPQEGGIDDDQAACDHYHAFHDCSSGTSQDC